MPIKKIVFLLLIMTIQTTYAHTSWRTVMRAVSSYPKSIMHKIINLFTFKKSKQRFAHCSSYGSHSYGSVNVRAWGEKNSYCVGKFCSIADNVTVFLGGNHRVDWISTYPFPAFTEEFPGTIGIQDHATSKGNVIIGNDVWIGSHATIMSGVTIGDGAVIGAYSVVAKNVPPYAIVVGNPARIVRYRFDEKTIEQLLKIQWWNWPLEKIKNNARLLCTPSVDIFLQKNT